MNNYITLKSNWCNCVSLMSTETRLLLLTVVFLVMLVVSTVLLFQFAG